MQVTVRVARGIRRLDRGVEPLVTLIQGVTHGGTPSPTQLQTNMAASLRACQRVMPACIFALALAFRSGVWISGSWAQHQRAPGLV